MIGEYNEVNGKHYFFEGGDKLTRLTVGLLKDPNSHVHRDGAGAVSVASMVKSAMDGTKDFVLNDMIGVPMVVKSIKDTLCHVVVVGIGNDNNMVMEVGLMYHDGSDDPDSWEVVVYSGTSISPMDSVVTLSKYIDYAIVTSEKSLDDFLS